MNIALVGKYIQLHDAYISVVEALKHGGIANSATVNIKWVDSELVTEENVDDILRDQDGILVPGGFGDRGIEGKITAIEYARTHNKPVPGPVPWYAAGHCRICPPCGRTTVTPTAWS